MLTKGNDGEEVTDPLSNIVSRCRSCRKSDDKDSQEKEGDSLGRTPRDPVERIGCSDNTKQDASNHNDRVRADRVVILSIPCSCLNIFFLISAENVIECKGIVFGSSPSSQKIDFIDD